MARSNPQITANSVTSFLKSVFELVDIGDGARCYRGESDSSWELRPSIMRGVRPDAESRIFSELTQEAPSEFASDRSMFDKLVRAQHYGLPTRLLDVSLNPLVGLYFACNELERHGSSGVVRVFDFKPTRVKYADSDTVSLISNLARLSDREREAMLAARKDLWTPTAKKAFRNSAAVRRLMQFVRVEKSYFLNQVDPVDLFRYFFVYPTKNNRRVIAQSGAFIAAGLLQYSSPDKSPGFEIHSIHIPARAKGDILRELDLININSRTMFPEVEFASRYIRDRWTLHDISEEME